MCDQLMSSSSGGFDGVPTTSEFQIHHRSSVNTVMPNYSPETTVAIMLRHFEKESKAQAEREYDGEHGLLPPAPADDDLSVSQKERDIQKKKRKVRSAIVSRRKTAVYLEKLEHELECRDEVNATLAKRLAVYHEVIGDIKNKIETMQRTLQHPINSNSSLPNTNFDLRFDLPLQQHQHQSQQQQQQHQQQQQVQLQMPLSMSMPLGMHMPMHMPMEPQSPRLSDPHQSSSTLTNHLNANTLFLAEQIPATSSLTASLTAAATAATASEEVVEEEAFQVPAPLISELYSSISAEELDGVDQALQLPLSTSLPSTQCPSAAQSEHSQSEDLFGVDPQKLMLPLALYGGKQAQLDYISECSDDNLSSIGGHRSQVNHFTYT